MTRAMTKKFDRTIELAKKIHLLEQVEHFKVVPTQIKRLGTRKIILVKKKKSPEEKKILARISLNMAYRDFVEYENKKQFYEKLKIAEKMKFDHKCDVLCKNYGCDINQQYMKLFNEKKKKDDDIVDYEFGCGHSHKIHLNNIGVDWWIVGAPPCDDCE